MGTGVGRNSCIYEPILVCAVVTVLVLNMEERSEAVGPDEIDDGRLGVEADGLEKRDGGGGGGGTRRSVRGPVL